MFMREQRASWMSVGLALLALPAIAAAAHNEATDGDLSGDFASPTLVSVTPNGTTAITGSIAGAGNHTTRDVDYFTFTVPAGQNLTGFRVRSGTVGSGTGSFIGLFAGSVAGNPATPPPVLGPTLLGYYLYGAADADTDILPKMGTFSFAGFNPQGFTPPLPSGSYTLWMQEGDLGTFDYAFDVQLSNVPEPTTLGAVAGLLALVGRRRRVV